jgi:hypothetical protein
VAQIGSGLVVGFCEHGIESFGSMKAGTFLHQLSDYYLLYKDFIPWSQLIKQYQQPQIEIFP